MNVIDVHYDLTEIKVLLFLLSFMASNIYCPLLGRIDTANKLVVFATIVNWILLFIKAVIKKLIENPVKAKKRKNNMLFVVKIWRLERPLSFLVCVSYSSRGEDILLWIQRRL